MKWTEPYCFCTNPDPVPLGFEEDGQGGLRCSGGFVGAPQLRCQQGTTCLAQSEVWGCVSPDVCHIKDFLDEDDRPGRITGKVAFGPAVVEGMVDEEQVEGYDIFFADDCGEAMGAAIARVPRAPIMAKGGCCEVMHYTVDLAAVVPQGAAKLLVATRGIRTGKAVDINDFALGPTTTTAGRKTPVTGASACFSLWLPAMALAWVMAR